MKLKPILCAAASAAVALATASDTPEVENVTMVQASRGREVTVTYELANAPDGAVVTFDVETNRTGSVTSDDADWISIGGVAVCNAEGAVWRKVTSADSDAQGKYTIKWRPDLSWEGHRIDLSSGGARAVVTAWAFDNTPDYMVVDISAAAQPNTQKYYPGADFIPGGILDKPEYRTTKLVMRKIMAKGVEWTMGSTVLESQRNETLEATHQVTLTNNYYIGVFEITQAQWGLIQPSRTAPSAFNNAADRAMRPVENVCYAELRNSASATANTAYDWPADPNPDSFLGLLKTKTGIFFDLPTEAQWEFAARAGNGDTKWGDGSAILNTDTDANMNLLGRYKLNGGYVSGTTSPSTDCSAANGTAIVGSYAPNSWGLYDMAGNVWEWCLDWYEEDITAHGGKLNIDPASPQKALSGAAGSSRAKRGGCWEASAKICRPANRNKNGAVARYNYNGLRVVCTAGLK